MDDITAINKRGVPGSTLKLIAIFVMLIDHIAATILDNVLITRDNLNAVHSTDFISSTIIYNIDSIMRMIGRIGFPLFCFLLVEGFVHTRNKGKYTIRLAAFALISEIPFDLAFEGKAFYFGYQNVFFTLLIGFLVMWGFLLIKDNLQDKSWFPILSVIGAFGIFWALSECVKSILYIVNSITVDFMGRDLVPYSALSNKGLLIGVTAIVGVILTMLFFNRKSEEDSLGLLFADGVVLTAGMLLANLLSTDYSAFGVLTIAVMYALRRRPILSGLGGYITLVIMSLTELTAAIALIPIGKYNGERGLSLKYVFYAFYPVHLFILYLICRAMNII